MSTYPIYTKDLSEVDYSKKNVVNTINQYSYCIAEKDPIFKKALQESDILLPDGVGITFMYKFLYGKSIKKIAGADLHAFLLEKLSKNNGSCFYLGSSVETLKLIEQSINIEFPSIRVGTYSPPFKVEFSPIENAAMIEAVNHFQPDVLFIGMTAPKQEKWLHQNKALLQAGTIGSIGAVFDFYAGTVKRPSQIWINLGLEWLIRLIKEPKRMWKRYIYYGPVFVYYLLRAKLNSKY